MLNAYSSEYQARIAEQRIQISELSKENFQLLEELEKFKEKEKLISSALINAEKRAQEIIEQAELQYSLEVAKLKKFCDKWDEYFNMLKEKYPLYPTTKKAIKIKEKIVQAEKISKSKKIIEEVDAMLSEDGQVFDPKSKIRDYIAATSDNGFNMNDVLNPGKLELEDLCKELGLIEENE